MGGLGSLYEKTLPEGQEFDVNVKVATVVNGSKDKLRDQLTSRQFATFEMLKAYIEEFYDSRKAFVAPSTKQSKVQSDDMEVDALVKGRPKGKGRARTARVSPR